MITWIQNDIKIIELKLPNENEFFLPCLFNITQYIHKLYIKGKKNILENIFISLFIHGIEFPLKLYIIVRVNILKSIHKKMIDWYRWKIILRKFY